MNIEQKIAVIGLGYVGLPLSIEFAKHFHVLGYDKNIKKLENKINKFYYKTSFTIK